MRLTPLVVILALSLECGGQVFAQTPDSIEAEKTRYLEALRKRIAGTEERPATEVFKNIRIMKKTTAGRLRNVMEFGYSRSLGVGCTYCHVPGE